MTRTIRVRLNDIYSPSQTNRLSFSEFWQTPVTITVEAVPTDVSVVQDGPIHDTTPYVTLRIREVK